MCCYTGIQAGINEARNYHVRNSGKVIDVSDSAKSVLRIPIDKFPSRREYNI